MFKRLIVLLVFFALLIFVGMQTYRLPLSIFVMLPMILLPVLYVYDSPQKKNFLLMSGCFCVFTFIYALFLRSFNLIFFGLILAVSSAIFFFYRRKWVELMESEESLKRHAVSELDQLKLKYDSRMESLHHLESQVGSLIDLYEIARDFNECLNLGAVAKILQKKVLPELQFKKLSLVVRRQKAKQAVSNTVFQIDQESVDDWDFNDGEDCPQDTFTLERELVLDAQGVVRDQKKWIFPLLAEEKYEAFAVVESAQEEDLAKFEVLMAYLSLQIKKVELYDEVKELAIRDSLTGVFVRRHFMERFEEELRRSAKFELPLAILMLDIDLFKRYNDEHGHLAGDSALRKVSSLLTDNVRKLDIVARFGGEEFVIILPESSREGAKDVAERIRSNIARHHFMLYKERTRVTVSIGGAFFPMDVESGEVKEPSEEISHRLIEMADKALYRAKEEGRNQVVFYDEL